MTRSLEVRRDDEIVLEDVVAMGRAGLAGGHDGETVESMVSQYIAYRQLGDMLALYGDGRIWIMVAIIPVKPGIGSTWGRAALNLQEAGMRANPIMREAVRQVAMNLGYRVLISSLAESAGELVDRWMKFGGYEKMGRTAKFYPNGEGAVHYRWMLTDEPAKVAVR